MRNITWLFIVFIFQACSSPKVILDSQETQIDSYLHKYRDERIVVEFMNGERINVIDHKLVSKDSLQVGSKVYHISKIHKLSSRDKRVTVFLVGLLGGAGVLFIQAPTPEAHGTGPAAAVGKFWGSVYLKAGIGLATFIAISTINRSNPTEILIINPK